MTDDRRRIPEFYKLSVADRVRAVHERGIVTGRDFRALASGRHTLDAASADKMVENVVGVIGLPLGLGMNLIVNGRGYVVPMAVEEPSVIAALGSASKLIGEHGGFVAEATDPVLIGQIQIVDLADIEAAEVRAAGTQAGHPQPGEQLSSENGRPGRRGQGISSCAPIGCRPAARPRWLSTCWWTPATPWAPMSPTGCARASPR